MRPDNKRDAITQGHSAAEEDARIQIAVAGAQQLSPPRLMRLDGTPHDRLTHYLFRFPAKFHPPVVRQLLEYYTAPSDVVLDPFCGSGTLLIEAAAMGRNAIGTDIDPVAVFVSDVKSRSLDPDALQEGAERLLKRLTIHERSNDQYNQFQFADLSPIAVSQILQEEQLWLPSIPNLFHWFRRYVVIDLARMLREISLLDLEENQRRFFYLCFASIIRNASNADPVPVSGLEVTAHMKRRDDNGRLINPFSLFRIAMQRALHAMRQYRTVVKDGARVIVLQRDATAPRSTLPLPVTAIITSPPYHNAVDYYRRHQLEMYWLRLTATHSDRLSLLPHYIGRPRVAQSHSLLTSDDTLGPLGQDWEQKMRHVSAKRADTFRHYLLAMRKVFNNFASIIRPEQRAVLVVGRSTWNGTQIPTAELFTELAHGNFRLEDYLWYPVRNRYMSYSRHNGANIDKEFVLVFRRDSVPTPSTAHCNPKGMIYE